MADAAHEHIEVGGPPARCFAIATDYERYPDWTSDVKDVVVHERDADGRATRVEYHVSGLGRRVRYVLGYVYDEAPHAFAWSLIEGDMLRALDGRYAFSPVDGGTLVDYSLRVELAVPMPGLVKRRASGMIMGNALRDLKRAVEHEMTDDEPTTPTSPEPDPDPATPVEVSDPVAPVDGGSEPAPHPDAVDFETAGTEERPLPPPSIIESVISELLGAVPEVKDHVLEAADALLDAAKALIDAADRVMHQQRGED
jgi:hypothetical protein